MRELKWGGMLFQEVEGDLESSEINRIGCNEITQTFLENILGKNILRE